MSLQSIIDATKQTALLMYKDKSNEELHSIFSHNSIIANGHDQIAAAKAVGEMQACNEILQVRQHEVIEQRKCQQKIDQAKQVDWPEQLPARRMKAILKLPNASGHPGQLVAAILEEENDLDRDAIRSWSEELLAMDDKSYEALLDGLVKEGVLAVDKKGHYSLLRICTANLFPENPTEWAKAVLTEKGVNMDEKMLALLQYLADTCLPVSELDALKIAGTDYEKSYNFDCFSPPKVFALYKLTDSGVLSKTRIDGTAFNLYYFPMLGE